MTKITAAQVKELRDKTSVGMMDAKKALVAADGDMQKAVDELREKGVAKAAKKSSRIAAEGLAAVKVADNRAVLLEVNSETDFVASNDKFKQLVSDLSTTIVENNPNDLAAALKLPIAGADTVEAAITNLTAVIGEKITLRRFQVVEKNDSQVFGSYLHNGGKVAALVVLDGADGDTAHDVAMHVAAINPEYLSREQVPDSVLKHERQVFTEETLNEGKPEKIVPKIVEGRLNKYLAEISLADQDFVKDPDQTVSQFVAAKGGKLVSFERYQVGEGIEKRQENFVDEVMGQIK